MFVLLDKVNEWMEFFTEVTTVSVLLDKVHGWSFSLR